MGFTPTTPQREAGCRIDPPVSVPKAPNTWRAATDAALPPDEPPGVRSRSHGFRHGPKALFSLDEPMANSSMLSLPSTTAPAAASRSTTVASKGGTNPSRMREPQVVSSPLVRKMSFSAMGTPSRRERGSPRTRRASEARASAMARSGATRRKAWSLPSVASMRASEARMISSEETSRSSRARHRSVSDRSRIPGTLTR